MKRIASLVLGAAASMAVATSAQAALTLDVRLQGGGDAALINPGDVVTLELTAVIDNNNGVADESLVQTGFGLRSSTGGLLGNISTMTLNPSFAAIPGSLVGTQSDTDADTDLDLINALASAGAGQQVVGSSFVLGTFTFTASGSATGITQIQVVPNPTNTLFRQDGTFGAGTTFGVNPGTPVTLTVVPEPVSLGLVGMAGLALMGRRRRQA